jgi:hypothetical protein
MKISSEKIGLSKLRALKDALRSRVAAFETNAQPCSTCDTPGECCLDEHFVNVRISRLEARAIANVIARLPAIRRSAISERIDNASAELICKTPGIDTQTFACPLYEKGTGCLVHDEAKPVPCIVHACYERPEDLPPDALQDAAELAIDKLNERVYGRTTQLELLPIAIRLTADG